MLEAYQQHVAERSKLGIDPKPLSAEQVNGLIDLLKEPPSGQEAFILDLLENRIPAGVDDAAYVKAGFLTAVAKGESVSPLVDKKKATELLGTMLGGYNITSLVELLDDDEVAEVAVAALSRTLLMFDAFHDVVEKAKTNQHAQTVVEAWANADWFTAKPKWLAIHLH